MNPGLYPNPAPLARTFVSAEVTLATGGAFLNVQHGLAGTPSKVRAVLVCKVANLGYVPGDEVDCAYASDSATDEQAFTLAANATQVALTCASTTTSRILNKADGTGPTAITAASWKAKIYAEL